MESIFNRLFILLFCIAICIPFVALVMQNVDSNNTTSSILVNEKRRLTPWPNYLVFEDDTREYTQQINKYIEDRFIFRSDLLRFTVNTRYDLFRLESNSGALLGKNGWAYLKDGISNAIGLSRPTDQFLVQWADNAAKIKQRVERNGGVFLIMIPPDKPQLYPEFMNDQFNYKPNARLISRLKPLLEQRDITTIDLLDDLIEFKKQSPTPLLYSKTGTHWTHKGALRGYKKLISVLQNKGLNLSTVNMSHLRKIEQDNFSGDVAGLLGLSEKLNEPIEYLLAQQSYDLLSPKLTLLQYGDSFTGKLIDFLRYSFRSFNCVHHNYGKPNLSLIERYNADVVILQMIERSLVFPLELEGEVSTACL